ncbi:MAG: hypothetical protein H0X30_17850 [Anaerolineae bacterium]|nr:hypothetical protein [Anaerolineae bacterium]
MTDIFVYEIITLKAEPSSDYRFIARVGSITRNWGDKPEIVLWYEHQLSEVWGMTEEEAYNKLENMIKDWIAKQKQ